MKYLIIYLLICFVISLYFNFYLLNFRSKADLEEHLALITAVFALPVFLLIRAHSKITYKSRLKKMIEEDKKSRESC